MPDNVLPRAVAMMFDTDAGAKVLAWLDGQYIQRTFTARPGMTPEAAAIYDAGARDLVINLKRMQTQGHQSNA